MNYPTTPTSPPIASSLVEGGSGAPAFLSVMVHPTLDKPGTELPMMYGESTANPAGLGYNFGIAEGMGMFEASPLLLASAVGGSGGAFGPDGMGISEPFQDVPPPPGQEWGTEVVGFPSVVFKATPIMIDWPHLMKAISQHDGITKAELQVKINGFTRYDYTWENTYDSDTGFIKGKKTVTSAPGNMGVAMIGWRYVAGTAGVSSNGNSRRKEWTILGTAGFTSAADGLWFVADVTPIANNLATDWKNGANADIQGIGFIPAIALAGLESTDTKGFLAGMMPQVTYALTPETDSDNPGPFRTGTPYQASGSGSWITWSSFEFGTFEVEFGRSTRHKGRTVLARPLPRMDSPTLGDPGPPP